MRLFGRCVGTTASGAPCRKWASRGRHFCWRHDPERVSRKSDIPPPCAFMRCRRPSSGRHGLCISHRRMQLAGKSLRHLRRYLPGEPCVIVGCERLSQARGMCNAHYERWRHGSKKRGALHPPCPLCGAPKVRAATALYCSETCRRVGHRIRWRGRNVEYLLTDQAHEIQAIAAHLTKKGLRQGKMVKRGRFRCTRHGRLYLFRWWRDSLRSYPPFTSLGRPDEEEVAV